MLRLSLKLRVTGLSGIWNGEVWSKIGINLNKVT